MIVEPVESELGPVRVWEEPKSSEEYVIGVDVAEGKASKDIHDPSGNRRDWSVATVLRVSDGAMVCQYKSQVDSATLTTDLYMLGLWYNEAMIAVETNSMGIGVVHMLIQGGYKNIYQPKVGTMVGQMAGTPDYLGIRSMGWVTTKATKPILVAAIHEALANGNRIPSMDLIRELKTIEFDQNGRIGAPQGGHDDQMMSYGIALVVRGDYLGGRASKQDEVSRLPAEDAKIWRLAQLAEERIIKQMTERIEDEF